MGIEVKSADERFSQKLFDVIEKTYPMKSWMSNYYARKSVSAVQTSIANSNPSPNFHRWN